MKTKITYKDGKIAEFEGGDPLELDLDGEHAASIFHVGVHDDSGKLVMSAYHWHNDPNKEETEPKVSDVRHALGQLVLAMRNAAALMAKTKSERGLAKGLPMLGKASVLRDRAAELVEWIKEI